MRFTATHPATRSASASSDTGDNSNTGRVDGAGRVDGVDGVDRVGDADFPCLAHRAPPRRPRAPRPLAAAIDAGLAPDPAARPPLHALLDVLDEHAGRPAGPARWRR